MIDDGGGAGGFTLIYHWFRAEYILFLAFFVAWDLFLLLVYGRLVSSWQLFLAGFWYVAPFAAVGLVGTYWAVAKLKNRTIIEIRDDLLSVRHGPLPWVGDKTIPADRFSQFYCDRLITYNRTRANVTYRLNLLTTSGQKIKLVGGIDTLEEARRLERRIEEYLAIQNQPVAGEAQELLPTEPRGRRSRRLRSRRQTSRRRES